MRRIIFILCLISCPAYGAIGHIEADVLDVVSISTDGSTITVTDGDKFTDCQYQSGFGYVCSF